MPLSKHDTRTYRQDVKANGNLLTAADREALLKKYLPTPPSQASKPRSSPADRSRRHRPRIRSYLKSLIHVAFHLLVQFIFGVYIRLRQLVNSVFQKFLSIRHYHHRTPAYIKKDTDSLSRLPEHLSVLLRYDELSEDPAALETLIDEVAELAAWSTAAGIPLLSVYEKTGVLKTYMSAVQELVHQKLVQYFGAAPHTPTLKVYAPNLPTLAPMPPPIPSPEIRPMNGMSTSAPHDHRPGSENLHARQSRTGVSLSDLPATQTPLHLKLLFLSATDGRDTLVDLTRTLTEMSQSAKIHPRDITTSLINTEINATTAIPTSTPGTPDLSRNSSFTTLNGGNGNTIANGHCHDGAPSVASSIPSSDSTTISYSNPGRLVKTSAEALPSEPDLLIIFAPYVRLDGYPPWQIRLTEIYCVGDSGGDFSGRMRHGRTRVEYQGFLRGLWKYAGAQMKFGR